jgi:two component regulator with propeller domain
MKFFRLLLSCLLLLATGLAEGTRLWQQSKYDEFEKGTAHGVAINSDGGLSLARALIPLYTSPSTYLWSLVSDANGNVYAAAGSPARVYKITPEGTASFIFAPQELAVQALAIDQSGAIYAATSPDGKVYKILPGGPVSSKIAEGSPSAVPVDPSYSARVFFEPKTKYIWALALDKQGRLYVGTGDQGEIFRVEPSGKGTVFFKSDEAQVRVLAFDHAGNLIAGTDGSGLLYRITPQGEGFVLYSAPKKEITALAVDSNGNIYAAGTGDKRAAAPGAQTNLVGTPTTPPTTIVMQQAAPQASGSAPGVAAIPFPTVMNLGGSEVYLITSDGAPKTIWSSKDEIVYALAFDQAGHLLAGTGNKGRIYSIGDGDYTDLAKPSANQVTAFSAAPQGGIFAATSNLGKVFAIGANAVAQGTYESDVFDAKIFSKWGRSEVHGIGNFDLFARSGNVENPDRNWSSWKKVDLAKDLPIDAPPARFIQWKAVLHSGNPTPVLERVAINYLPRNVAPEVDDVTVTVGARVPSSTRTSNTTVDSSTYEAPIPTVPDKRSIAVKWRAHDANDDELTYSVYYRGDNETQWKKLRDEVADRYANLESDLFPDGSYTIRVVASDESSHSPGEAMTGEKTSERFEVDNTPPIVEFTNTRIEGNRLHLAFRAVDGLSPISRAEYSIDADDWQTAEPVGQISDYKVENYDLTVPMPTPTDPKEPAANEHTVVVRVFDRYDNVGVAKTVIKSVAPGAAH